MSNAFPKYAGTIVAVITGSFDASAAVFLFYRLVYESSTDKFGLRQFFSWYTVVPLLIFTSQIAILPKHSYQTMPQLEENMERAQDASNDVHESDEEIESPLELARLWDKRKSRRQTKIRKLTELIGDEEERQQKVDREAERVVTSGVWGILHGQSAHQQMRSLWFNLITLVTITQMLR